MFRRKWKFLLAIILLVVLSSQFIFFTFISRAVTEYYNPPVQKTDDPKVQILNDMTVLSGAVEAYYAKNLTYPDKLEQLKPEFIDQIPLETGTEKLFIYESDGLNRYRITVSDPSRYGFKELFIENGNITQK